MTRRLHLLAAALLVAACGLAADWPRYRGPEGTGISPETGLLTSWPEGGPRERWRVSLGDGYSGIAIAGGRVYTLYGRAGGEFLACFNAADGTEAWRVRIDAHRGDSQGGGPRSTPTVDGDLVFALGARGVLVAVNARSGERIWDKDLKEAFAAPVPRWGVSTSPLVEGELLLLDVGGGDERSIVALDKRTGSTRWATFSDKPGYSTPFPVTIAGERQVLFFTRNHLVSVAPRDGRVLWDVGWETPWGVNAAMPVFMPPEGVFVSTSYDVGAARYDIKRQGGTWKARERWRNQVMKNHFNSSIHHEGHLYGFDDTTLKCIDAATGKERWKARGYRKGSLILADGHLIVLSEDGVLALIEATPKRHREKARAQVFQGRTWTMPSLADGVLYLRNQEEMVALEIAR